MNIQPLLLEIADALKTTFHEIDNWFDKPENCQNHRPKNGAWTVAEILEHISLTNHFLLILIEKGAKKALSAAQGVDLKPILADYVFHRDKLDEVGLYQSFPWVRPEHMEPSGEKPLPEIREILKMQVARCLDVLESLKNGEGLLYKTTMTVNDLGKIDVYEYIYFLAQHGRRHIEQMSGNERAFLGP